LFCPAIGIALDSSARVIVLLDRPVDASALGPSFAGSATEPAGGTVGFAAGDRVVPGSTLMGSTGGTVGSTRGSVGPFSHALSSNTEKHQAANVTGARIEVPQWSDSSGQSSTFAFGLGGLGARCRHRLHPKLRGRLAAGAHGWGRPAPGLRCCPATQRPRDAVRRARPDAHERVALQPGMGHVTLTLWGHATAVLQDSKCMPSKPANERRSASTRALANQAQAARPATGTITRAAMSTGLRFKRCIGIRRAIGVPCVATKR